MPRVAGQIDLAKTEAILDAAVEVLAERGLSASMEEIARRACVSKQTIYNHYGSKAELVRAMVDRRVHEMVAPLETPEGQADPELALAGFGRILLAKLLEGALGRGFFRAAILGAAEAPEVAKAVYEAGPRQSRQRLAEFLELETRAGRLACPDPMEAAEFYAGMVIGSYQTAALLGVDRGLDAAKVDRIATEAAARFLKAYAA
ncbi:TetR/AcrR family transcriptional regulator [Phenylobacterium sp. J367]|uniref:TetR/AcrR family transcriptional regulator n=1 Tax=Phenylobacterium sp. J367 TaxID=2898435 RepID=UPI002151220D|nr:TetR/AcrR family transcriptional regulator [Phenylobacterium sp. J367]MCR5878098.1 TetR/AcrR family transcriptional regulator [Phenylobacterium sp. J367]